MSSKEWLISLELLNTWSWGSDGPEVRHAQFLLFSIDGLNDANWLGHGVLALWHEFNNLSIGLWISHNSMHLEKGVLVDITQLVSTCNQVSNFKIIVWVEVPELVLIQAWEFDTSWDKHAVSSFGNLLKWSLDTIENCLQNSYANIKLRGNNLPGPSSTESGFPVLRIGSP